VARLILATLLLALFAAPVEACGGRFFGRLAVRVVKIRPTAQAFTPVAAPAVPAIRVFNPVYRPSVSCENGVCPVPTKGR
jgi:hypothetical protein